MGWIIFAVGGDGLLSGFGGGPDPEVLAIGAAWSAAVAFILFACLLRWFVPPSCPAIPRRLLAAIVACVVALVATTLSANYERGFLAGMRLWFLCFVATVALPVVLGFAYLLRAVRRRSRGKTPQELESPDLGIHSLS